MRLRHVHLQQITIRALNAPSIPLSPPSDHFAVHLTHLIAKNNTDNRMEVVFLWVDRPWIAYIHMWRCVAMCGSCGKQQKETQTRGRTREEEKMCSIGTWETRLGKFRRGWLSKLGVFKAAGPTFISACPYLVVLFMYSRAFFLHTIHI